MSAERPTADPRAFKDNSRLVLADPVLRRNFRGAMDFLTDKRAAQFPDADAFAELRDLGKQIRQHALANLPQRACVHRIDINGRLFIRMKLPQGRDRQTQGCFGAHHFQPHFIDGLHRAAGPDGWPGAFTCEKRSAPCQFEGA